MAHGTAKSSNKSGYSANSKGFVRILEAIIASVVLLAALTFFFTLPSPGDEWSGIVLQNQGKDALSVAAESGVLQQAVANNDALLLEAFLSFLPKSVSYSVAINGIPSPVIRIGCNCTQSEISDLESRLAPLDFVYKGRNISMRVENVSLSAIRNDTDVLFLFGYKDLGAFEAELNAFLESGGTAFMLADLTEALVNDGVLNETFGLSWNASLAMSGSGSLHEASNPARQSFRVAKYYENTTGNEPGVFTGFNAGGGINMIDADEKTIIKDNSALGGSLVKSNPSAASGLGRTVWMADGNGDGDLLKAVIMWSDESFLLDSQPRTPGRKNVKTSILVYDEDPYVASITLWNVFE